MASYDPPKLSHSSFLRRILATLDCSSSSRDPSWFWNKKNIPRSWLFRNPVSSSVRPRASSLAPATRPSAMTEVVQPVDVAPPPVNALVRVRNPPDATPPPSRWQLRRVVVETRASEKYPRNVTRRGAFRPVHRRPSPHRLTPPPDQNPPFVVRLPGRTRRVHRLPVLHAGHHGSRGPQLLRRLLRPLPIRRAPPVVRRGDVHMGPRRPRTVHDMDHPRRPRRRARSEQ